MRRIQQKSINNADCGIACVAMLTGCTYQVAFDKLKNYERNGQYYTNHKALIGAIKSLGRTATKIKFMSFRNIQGKAIVAINKRKDGCWHWVVFNGQVQTPYIFDPNPIKKSKIVNFRGLRGFGYYIQISNA